MVETREARLHLAPVLSPTISMLETGGMEASKTRDIPLARLHLRGAASHAGGISAVSINRQAADPVHKMLLGRDPVKEVRQTLQDRVSPARVSALVTKFGMDLTLSGESGQSLRAAAADNALLGGIANAKR